MEKLPFMATENIMMEAVKRGGDRQELHERLRVHSHAAAAQVKQLGEKNDLISRIASDPAFGLTEEEITGHLDPKLYTGRSASQTLEFFEKVAIPAADRYSANKIISELKV